MAGIAVVGAMALPSAVAAAEKTYTYKIPISVASYEVKQGFLTGPKPDVDGYVTKMETDLVDANGERIPIRRLMLHHIVFLNSANLDTTCERFRFWDNQSIFEPAGERFYAAGEERAKMRLPDGYGYPIKAGDPNWGIVYMFMNHRAKDDTGFVQYRVTVDDDPAIKPVKPHWLDARNCRADPVYNVPGDGGKASTHVKKTNYLMPASGRIVAGLGHAHGGARKLTITRPKCSNRPVAESVPTWGKGSHSFYEVRPILHEPGPIHMTAFRSQTGIPVRKGEKIRLNSRYENSMPHVRVMGIFVVYVAEDASVAQKCQGLPKDMETVKTKRKGRKGPIPYEIPLTGFKNGKAVDVKAPPGGLEDLKGRKLDVVDRVFLQPNVRVDRGTKLKWKFRSQELHNVTLANGPAAVAGPNLDGGRVFERRLREPGTYRFFCSLHPTDMIQRVKVERR
ncbi:MAG: plastocyanin/azurin family copper-binding protein [Solirubrobacterales bacterium]